jgi:hypothetical protein
MPREQHSLPVPHLLLSQVVRGQGRQGDLDADELGPIGVTVLFEPVGVD